MKKIGKLNINPKKLIKSDDLQKLKGGETYSWLFCLDGYGVCEMPVARCDDEQNERACRVACTGWSQIICIG